MRLLIVFPLLALALTGCSEAVDAATTARDCAGLARDVVSSGLSGVPSQEEAEAARRSLEDRVGDLQDEDVRAAATALRDRLDELAAATRDGDPSAVTGAADAARAAAGQVADACGLPADQFVG